MTPRKAKLTVIMEYEIPDTYLDANGNVITDPQKIVELDKKYIDNGDIGLVEFIDTQYITPNDIKIQIELIPE